MYAGKRCALLLVIFISVGTARAGESPAVKDAGGLFSPAALRRAEERISAVEREYGFPIVVETLPSPPPFLGLFPMTGRVKAMSLEERDRYFARLARRRAPRNGLWILICKEPLHVQVAPGRGEEINRMFGRADCNRLREQLAAHTRPPELDAALEQTLTAIGDIAEKHRADQLPLSPAFTWATVWQVVVAIVVAWLVLEVVNRVRARRLGTGPPAGAADPTGEGGSLLPGLFVWATTPWPAAGPRPADVDSFAPASAAGPSAAELPPDGQRATDQPQDVHGPA